METKTENKVKKVLALVFTPISGTRKMNPIRKRDDGSLRYVYNVTGTPEELAAYKAANPKAITDTDTNMVLYFSKKFHGKTASLEQGENGWFIQDNVDDAIFAGFCKEGGVEYANLKMKELRG